MTTRTATTQPATLTALPPCWQKRKYNKASRDARVKSAKGVSAMTKPQLRQKLSLAMDGVILALLPSDPTERMNFCCHGEDHMWRKGLDAEAAAMAKRPVLGKTAYKARVRSLARSRKLQSVASSQTLLMKKVCREVVRRKGEATSF